MHPGLLLARSSLRRLPAFSGRPAGDPIGLEFGHWQARRSVTERPRCKRARCSAAVARPTERASLSICISIVRIRLHHPDAPVLASGLLPPCSPQMDDRRLLVTWPGPGAHGPALLRLRRLEIRSGQVYYSAKIRGHESHKAAWATSETRIDGFESSYYY